jgi:hypothetical protein
MTLMRKAISLFRSGLQNLIAGAGGLDFYIVTGTTHEGGIGI